jgi:hypothetical protein
MALKDGGKLLGRSFHAPAGTHLFGRGFTPFLSEQPLTRRGNERPLIYKLSQLWNNNAGVERDELLVKCVPSKKE